VKQNTKRKTRYQDSIGELETKEPEWQSLEKILRDAIARLCTVGQGLDKNLDQQLELIQSLSQILISLLAHWNLATIPPLKNSLQIQALLKIRLMKLFPGY